MTRLFFDHALTSDGWAEKVSIQIDGAGNITAVETDTSDDNANHRAFVALPGIPNTHSHAFQRAMAGRAEIKGDTADTFWTWRQVMYQFLERITPDDLFAIASMAYCEMLEAGFTSVCEFHYLHHAPDGSPYSDIGEMANAIVEAAKETGIGLTLLPVYYAHSQFGGAAPDEKQRRFINNIDQFAKLLGRVDDLVTAIPDAKVGIAPHSLRAVTAESLAQLSILKPDAPMHIHIAEQIKEVEDCLIWSEERPVNWLMEHAEVNERWCLVHATHLSTYEREQIIKSGAIAGLCPITEANLGDGIFNGVDFLTDGGRIGIGSDSNVLISVAEELRTLEYSQRLRDRGRNMLSQAHKSTGQHLVEKVLQGGAQASGRKIGKLAPGYRGDIIALDQNHPAFAGVERESWMNNWVFAANSPALSNVWVCGQLLMSTGQHHKREKIRARYAQTMRGLLA